MTFYDLHAFRMVVNPGKCMIDLLLSFSLLTNTVILSNKDVCFKISYRSRSQFLPVDELLRTEDEMFWV